MALRYRRSGENLYPRFAERLRRPVETIGGNVRGSSGGRWLKQPALYGDARATLGPACVDYRAATSRFHANQKAMRLFAARDGRLISAFHDVCSVK